ncbi:hypothetical protein EFD55_24790 [Rhizobium pisi]|uniref:ABM domain-containing protein n=1 Tax=Rhizobium pisi TaxID=574561 RepID=A0A427MEW3_9HYPH|nr:hypothetical protein EFD55_24790 [Rhizobium pisi]TCA49744.1 hypothetical protein E0J16_23560 [Rhizobium pisi]
MSILLTIAFETKPDKLTAFLELLATVKAELPGTAGCEDIRILQKIDEPTSVSLIETWGSRSNIKRMSRPSWRTVDGIMSCPTSRARR